MIRRCVLVVAVGVTASVVVSGAVLAPAQRWQPPDPTNLQVLPADIPKPRLVQTMRGFTEALGVRCEFCHVGEGNDLSRFDFASDAKRQKRNARVMMRMVQDLNAKYLASVPEPRDPAMPAVTCITCHRGQQTPAR